MSNGAKQDISVSLSPEEAFLAIIMLAVQADGIFALAEKEVVRFAIEQRKIFQNSSQEELIEKMDEDLKKIKIKGEQTVLEEAVRVLPAKLYTTAFTIAADIVSSDGKITPKEADILNRIQQALSIPQDTVDKIIEVMKYKNYHHE